MTKLAIVNGTVKDGEGNPFLLTGVSLPTGRSSPGPGENTKEMVHRWNEYEQLVKLLEKYHNAIGNNFVGNGVNFETKALLARCKES